MGPSWQLLDSLFAEAGAKRSEIYLTNAVKHFGYRPSGRKRLHVTPNADQIDHCRWWLELERKFIRPKVILALGATALRSLTGEALRLTDQLGKPLALSVATLCVPSWHPAYVLRRRSDADRAAARQQMVSHLQLALQLAG
jgi:DNA polymerase